MPSWGVAQEQPFMPFWVTPIPAKLFCPSVTAEPEKVKFPVSRQDWAKAMSPRTPSAAPSERYSGTISTTLCATSGFAFRMYVCICVAVVWDSPMMFVFPHMLLRYLYLTMIETMLSTL